MSGPSDRYRPRPVPADWSVGLAVAAYLHGDPRQTAALGCLLWSLKAQTFPRWQCVVVHDGPAPAGFANALHDPRIKFVETVERVGHHGHRHRRPKLLEHTTANIVGFTNQDNYYAPVYLEWMLHAMAERNALFVHADMVHSHQGWRAFPTTPVRGRIDLGCYLAARKLIEATPWPGEDYAADGHYAAALAKAAAGRIAHVGRLLYVHN